MDLHVNAGVQSDKDQTLFLTPLKLELCCLGLGCGTGWRQGYKHLSSMDCATGYKILELPGVTMACLFSRQLPDRGETW